MHSFAADAVIVHYKGEKSCAERGVKLNNDNNKNKNLKTEERLCLAAIHPLVSRYI